MPTANHRDTFVKLMHTTGQSEGFAPDCLTLILLVTRALSFCSAFVKHLFTLLSSKSCSRIIHVKGNQFFWNYFF